MKVVIQRVNEAKVVVDGKVTGAINKGYMILVGFKNGDSEVLNEENVSNVCVCSNGVLQCFCK